MKLTFDSYPSDPLPQTLDEIVAIQKECRGNISKIEAARVLVLAELEKRGFSKEVVRFAKKLLNSDTHKKKHTPLKVASINSLQPREAAQEGKERCKKGMGGCAPREQMAKVRELLHSLLLTTDDDALDIILGIAAAHELDVDAPWTFIVGPPGGGKTEMIEMFRKHPKALILSTLTPNTLASGLKEEDAVGGNQPSLLMKHPDSIFLFKDFTTVLSQHHDTRDRIFAQLREVYDGSYNAKFGTGGEIDWQGHISFMAGVTPVIYHQYKMMSTLGPRFFMLRLDLPERKEMMKYARKRINTRQLKLDLQQEVAILFELLDLSTPIHIPDEYEDWLVSLADFISISRAGVKRNSRMEVEELPEPEIGTRALLQLMNLAKGIAIINGRNQIGEDEKRMLLRIGWDTIPPHRAHIMRKLLTEKELGLADLRKDSTYSDEVIEQGLEDLSLLGIVQREQPESISRKWHLSPSALTWFNLLESKDLT